VAASGCGPSCGGGAVRGFIVRAQNRTFELKSQAVLGKIIPG
jgi:hypothetical protein